MKEDDDAYDDAVIMLTVEAYKLYLAHPAEPASSIAEKLGRLLELAEFPQPAAGALRRVVERAIAFDGTPLARLSPRGSHLKRARQK
jgi:hypothetical protein